MLVLFYGDHGVPRPGIEASAVINREERSIKRVRIFKPSQMSSTVRQGIITLDRNSKSKEKKKHCRKG